MFVVRCYGDKTGDIECNAGKVQCGTTCDVSTLVP